MSLKSTHIAALIGLGFVAWLVSRPKVRTIQAEEPGDWWDQMWSGSWAEGLVNSAGTEITGIYDGATNAVTETWEAIFGDDPDPSTQSTGTGTGVTLPLPDPGETSYQEGGDPGYIVRDPVPISDLGEELAVISTRNFV